MSNELKILEYVGAGIFTGVLLGVTGKIVWEWLSSGRVKKGEYYTPVSYCESNREKCYIHTLRKELDKHIRYENSNDSEVNSRLSNIEFRMQEAREENSAMRKDISGIRSALDKMTGFLDSYIKSNQEEREARDKGGRDFYVKK